MLVSAELIEHMQMGSLCEFGHVGVPCRHQDTGALQDGSEGTRGIGCRKLAP
jgi:hypothetical protein